MFRCKILHRSTVPTVFIILMFFLKLGADPVCAQDAAQDGGVKTKTIEIPSPLTTATKCLESSQSRPRANLIRS